MQGQRPDSASSAWPVDNQSINIVTSSLHRETFRLCCQYFYFWFNRKEKNKQIKLDKKSSSQYINQLWVAFLARFHVVICVEFRD